MAKKIEQKSAKKLANKKNNSPLNKIAKKVLLQSKGEKERGRKLGVKFPNGYKKNKSIENENKSPNEIVPEIKQDVVTGKSKIQEIKQEIVNIESKKENDVNESLVNTISNNTTTDSSINDSNSGGNEQDNNNINNGLPINENSENKNKFVRSGEDVFNDFVKENSTLKDSDYKPETEKETVYKEDTKHYSPEMNGLVNGYMLLTLCDFVFPGLIKKIMCWFDPKNSDLIKSVKTSDVQLTKDQMNSLEKSADLVAQHVFAQMNPLMIFTLSLTVMYYSNFKAAVDEIKVNRKKEKEDDKKTNFFKKELPKERAKRK